MMQLSREERLLHIGKMTNVRDLGGYETQEGYIQNHINMLEVHVQVGSVMI